MTAQAPGASDAFAEARGRLFGIAYRMLGSVADAEDLVQETWLRWHGADRSKIERPAAFLATTITRLAITASTTARARRETYVGPWLPEPVDTSNDPLLGAERQEALSFAMMLLLEKLTPTERAAYVLREAFAYSYTQIAEVVQLSEAASRQLVSRARRRLETGQPRRRVELEQHSELLLAFLSAAQRGDLQALEAVLAADVVSTSDGGGTVRASRIPVATRETVAKFVRAFQPRFWPGAQIEVRSINGAPAAVLVRGADQAPFAVVAVTASAEGIAQLHWVLNPAKLAHIPILS